MVFSSIQFLFVFLPLVLLLYFLAPGVRAKNAVLLLASLLFYAWGEIGYTWVLLASIVLGWAFGLWVERGHGRLALILGASCLLGLLLWFKYSAFLLDNLSRLPGLGPSLAGLPRSSHLPLGISFFIFQALSYLIDVQRRRVPAQASLFQFAVYKSFFPQLIAGPIVRYAEVCGQLAQRQTAWLDLDEGARRFVRGLVQKTLIANIVGKAADEIFGLGPGQLSAASAWLGAICYFFQIYFDFAGYSNMAIGMGRLFGFSFPENFEHPYASQSVREFWRRWHITLSRWFRDYLYFPLGGSRGSSARTYLNLGLTFLLCGLWHGAAWTFVVWGLFHGLLQIAERLFLGRWLQRAPSLLRRAYLLTAVLAAWVIFRCQSLGQAAEFFSAMAGLSGGPGAWPVASWLNGELWLALGAACVFSFPARQAGIAWLERRGHGAVVQVLSAGGLVFGLLLSAAWLSGDTFNPFIYFRF